jgi:hypothetical protein
MYLFNNILKHRHIKISSSDTFASRELNKSMYWSLTFIAEDCSQPYNKVELHRCMMSTSQLIEEPTMYIDI